MGIWSKLFSSENTIEKATDAVISAGDKIWYTDEEKADMKFKFVSYFPNILKAYEPFKIAQRILAVWFSLLFGISFLVGLTMETFNIWYKYQSLKDGIPIDKIILLDTQPLINLVSAFSLATIVGVIVGFYFMGGTIESFKRKEQ